MGRKVRPSPYCVVWTHGGLEPGGSRRGRSHSVDARSIRHWRWPPRISKGRGDAVNTHTSVTKKLAAVVVAAATSASLGLAAAAAYRVQATWDVLSGATSYNVSMSSGGTLLTSGKVSQPTSATVQWAGNVTLPPG